MSGSPLAARLLNANLNKDTWGALIAEAMRAGPLSSGVAQRVLHDYQRPPADHDWLIWILKGGRGSGKTLAGAEWIWEQAKRYPYIGIAAATFGDGRDYCIEGESGLKTLHPELEFNRSMGEMIFPSGARGKLFSGEEPKRARGPNLYALWCDEFCSWKYQRETWDMLMFALRKGESLTCITTTPKPSKLWAELQARDVSRVVKATTYQNIANLSRAYIENVIKPYEGTTLGRQELNAEDLTDVEGALWTHELINQHRWPADRELPHFTSVLVAVDPASTSKETSDEAGIVVVAKAPCNCKGESQIHAFVLADYTKRGTPEQWSRIAIDAWARHHADAIVSEVNQGGDMVGTIIGYAASERKIAVPHRTVWAADGKQVRATPIQMLYEQGRVHHVGNVPLLEDEMTTWIPGQGRSPNRIDALVWGVTELRLQSGSFFK